MTAREPPRARTIFLGTGAFAVPVVSALSAHPSVDLVAVVTAPQRIGARGKPVDSPVAQWSLSRGGALLRPERLRAAESIAQIEALNPELIVLADYGQIVPHRLLELPRHGALNLHPSLLPRHRGATPIPAAILAGDEDTGVTLMLMDEGLDTGPIVAQWRASLTGAETAPELEERLADQAARLLATTLEHWLEGEIRPDPQPEDGVTLTRPLRRADGRLDPLMHAVQLERQVRAYQPWPGSYFDTDGGRVVVWAAHSADEVDAGGEGDVGMLVRTADGRLGLVASDGTSVLDEVQPAGGRRMSSADLLRGRPGLVGSKIAAPADQGG